MIVISDTSPINYLTLIGETDILEKLFSRIVVPQAVFSELQHTKTPQQVKDWITKAPSWLEVMQADASLFTPVKRIGNGEREAIALAIELKADAILIDDRDGTEEARGQGLIALGTVWSELQKRTCLTCQRGSNGLARPLFVFHLERSLTRC